MVYMISIQKVQASKMTAQVENEKEMSLNSVEIAVNCDPTYITPLYG